MYVENIDILKCRKMTTGNFFSINPFFSTGGVQTFWPRILRRASAKVPLRRRPNLDRERVGNRAGVLP